MAKTTKTEDKAPVKKTAAKKAAPKTAAKKTAVKKTVVKAVAEKKPAAKKAPAKKAAPTKGIKKQVLDDNICSVTFCLPAEAVDSAQYVTIVGDFNGWDVNATPMQRLENGDYIITLTLQPGRDYRFRYLIDGSRWENDWAADRYEPNMHESEDSVVAL